jgi:hypothetical protein
MLPSCKKDLNSIIGVGLQPSDEYVYAVFDDTSAYLRLVSYTVEDNPEVTSGRPSYALGSYHDASFGTLTANIVTQVYDLSTRDSVPEIYQVDSAFLVLIYGDAYPFDENLYVHPITISIGELERGLDLDSFSMYREYYSNDDPYEKFGVKTGSVLSNYTFVPNLRDTILDPTDTTGEAKLRVPYLLVPLDVNNYPRKLLETSRSAAMRDSHQQTYFLEAITGLYLETHPQTMQNYGNVVNFDFSGGYGLSPGIKIYYSTPAVTEGGEDTIVSREKDYIFQFDGSMLYNYIEIDRTTATSPDLQNQLADSTLGEDKVFLQSFYGSMFRVEMPDIREFAKIANGKNIVINQACLVMNAFSNDHFTPASILNPVHRKDDTTMFGLRDSYIGGYFNQNKSEYRIYVTRHIQNLLLNPDAENFPLTIYSNARHYFPDITTIYGPSKAHGDRRMRLEVVYSVLP